MMVPASERHLPARFGGRDARRLVGVGVALLVVLLGVAAALWVAAGQRRADNVAGFARAPVGCDTILDFERGGRFTLFIETTGRIDALVGACDAELDYDRDPDRPTEPDLVLVGPDGDEIALDDADGADGYDVDGFSGDPYRSVTVETPGDHVLTVAPLDGEAFVVAVGRSADDGVALLRGSAVAAAIAALVLAGVAFVLGTRREPSAESIPDPWSGTAQGWPAGPPGCPPPPATTGAAAPAGPPRRPAPPMGSRPVSPPPEDRASPWGPPGSDQ